MRPHVLLVYNNNNNNNNNCLKSNIQCIEIRVQCTYNEEFCKEKQSPHQYREESDMSLTCVIRWKTSK